MSNSDWKGTGPKRGGWDREEVARLLGGDSAGFAEEHRKIRRRKRIRHRSALALYVAAGVVIGLTVVSLLS